MIHMKSQALFLAKVKIDITKSVVCCNHDCHSKGLSVSLNLENSPISEYGL